LRGSRHAGKVASFQQSDTLAHLITNLGTNTIRLHLNRSGLIDYNGLPPLKITDNCHCLVSEVDRLPEPISAFVERSTETHFHTHGNHQSRSDNNQETTKNNDDPN